jgi:hypothetical protein
VLSGAGGRGGTFLAGAVGRAGLAAVWVAGGGAIAGLGRVPVVMAWSGIFCGLLASGQGPGVGDARFAALVRVTAPTVSSAVRASRAAARPIPTASAMTAVVVAWLPGLAASAA